MQEKVKAIVVGCLLVASQAFALPNPSSETKRAMDLFQSGKREEAQVILKREADKGDPLAQFHTALLLDMSSEGKSADAAKYYKKSADQGYAPAELIYGVFLKEGLGQLKLDKALAKKYLEKALNNKSASDKTKDKAKTEISGL